VNTCPPNRGNPNPAYGLTVLGEVEVESRPARAEARPGADGVSGEENPPLRPVEGEVSRRISGRVEDLDGAHPVSVL